MRMALGVSYNGQNYLGWQSQPSGNTVQDKLEAALAQFATAWVLAHRAVSSVIAGPRTLAQWQDYFPALDYVVTPEDDGLVDELVAPGHPSTPGYTDPAYPLHVRRRV